MPKTINELISDPQHRAILGSLMPGGENWAAAIESCEIDCLETCPHYRACLGGYGPEYVCTSEWHNAEATPRVVQVLFHVVNNFDHYNVSDLPSLDRESSEVVTLLSRLNDLHESLFSGFEEGHLVTATHRYRERNSEAARLFKIAALSARRLRCQGCDTDYLAKYGKHGISMIECHHLVPLASEKHTGKTESGDLALLCANCHRLIHSNAINPTLPALREVMTNPMDPPEQS